MTIINADEGPVDTDARLKDILQGIAEGASPNGMSAVNKGIYAAYLKSLEEPEVVEEPEPEPEPELTPAQKAARTRAANKAKREAEAKLEAAVEAGD